MRVGTGALCILKKTTDIDTVEEVVIVPAGEAVGITKKIAMTDLDGSRRGSGSTYSHYRSF